MKLVHEPQPWYARAVAGVVLLAFVLRAVASLRRPFHTDERISLQWGSLPVKDMLQMVRTFDVHPPLLFLALHGLTWLHAPDWVPRLIAALLGTASVLMLAAIVRIWAGDIAAVFAAGCCAVMPVLVFYDTWVRMYVLSDALVLAQFLVLSVILTQPRTRRTSWLWAAWSLAAVLAGYTLYLAWFGTLAQALFVVFMRREQLAAMLVASVAAIVAWLPQLPALLHQLGMGGQTFQAFHGHEVSGVLLLSGQATLAPELEGVSATVAAAVAWLWIAVSLYAVLTQARSSLLPWLGVPALLTFIYGIATHKLIYLDRYYIFSAYALAAWTGVLVAMLVQHRQRWALAAAMALLTCVLVVGAGYAFDSNFYTADWPGVAATLSRGEASGDLVLAEQGMPFWTLPGDKDILSHEHLFIFYPNQIPKALKAANAHSRVWVIAYEPRGIDPDLVLLTTLNKSFHLVSAEPFNRYLPAEDVVLLLFAREKR